MRDKLNAAKQKLKSTINAELVSLTVGAAFGAIVVLKYNQYQYDQLRTLPLGRHAYKDLIDGATDGVWFTTGKHEHVFRVTLEQ